MRSAAEGPVRRSASDHTGVTLISKIVTSACSPEIQGLQRVETKGIEPSTPALQKPPE